MSTQLETETREKADLVRESRRSERVIKDLQYQLGERDKTKLRLEDDYNRLEDKLRKMRSQIEELEANESQLQVKKRKAERDFEEERERSAKLEKELEKLRSKFDKAHVAVVNEI